MNVAGEGQENQESNLRSDEVLDRPVGCTGDGVVGENLPAVEHDDDNEEDQRSVGCERLEFRVEGSVCTRDTLGITGFAETEAVTVSYVWIERRCNWDLQCHEY